MGNANANGFIACVARRSSQSRREKRTVYRLVFAASRFVFSFSTDWNAELRWLMGLWYGHFNPIPPPPQRPINKITLYLIALRLRGLGSSSVADDLFDGQVECKQLLSNDVHSTVLHDFLLYFLHCRPHI